MIWMIISGLIVGILLGFVMQRTRFCLAGGFRDMYVQKNNKMFYALLVAITVQSIGLLILTGLNVISIPDSTFPIIGTIIGAFIFGIGIVLAGGCATGTWWNCTELSQNIIEYQKLSYPRYNNQYSYFSKMIKNRFLNKLSMIKTL